MKQKISPVLIVLFCVLLALSQGSDNCHPTCSCADRSQQPCGECVNQVFQKQMSNGKRCVFCPGQFCRFCSSDFICNQYTQCPLPNQKPNLMGTQCFECNVANCLNCNLPGVCSKCARGYRFTNDAKCQLIPDCEVNGCLRCYRDRPLVCEICATDFTRTENFKCTTPGLQLCNNNPQCLGVPNQARQYIAENYKQENQKSSLLQASRTLQILNTFDSSTGNQQKIRAFKQLVRDAQCLQYNLGVRYDEALDQLQEILFKTKQQLETYLEVIVASGSQTLQLSQDPSDSCSFQINSTQGRSLMSNQRNLQNNQTQNCVDQPQSVLMFVNGVGYTPQGAYRNLVALGNAADSRQSTSFDVKSYEGPGTRDPSFFKDLITAFEQKTQEAPQTTRLYRALLRILADRIIPERTLPTKFAKELVKFIAEELHKVAVQQSQTNSNFILNQLKRYVLQGQVVVIVAHSQGTLYANSAFNLLSPDEKKSVRLAFVGAAASVVADGSNRWTTNPQDFVINSVRALSSQVTFDAPLPGNVASEQFDCVSVPLLPDFCVSHSFLGYLRTYRNLILTNIAGAKSETVQPQDPMVSSGPMTVTLSWDSQPDIDLHVFQPNGHVFYVQKQGANGFLDLDDVDGFGPQHYFTSCETLGQGTYLVALNYYAGGAPSRASVIVQAGRENYNTALTLSPSIGSSGNDNPPYKICVIIVTIKQPVQGQPQTVKKFEFEIIPL